MSDSSSVTVRRVLESTYGTTPTDSTAWLTYCLNSETLDGAPQTVESGKQCPGGTSRMEQAPTVETITAGGDIITELTTGNYDDILEAGMGGTWTADSLSVGTTDRSFTVEKEFTDQTKFWSGAGGRVAGFAIDVAGGAVGFTHTYAFGTVLADGTSSLVGLGSETPENSEDPIQSASGFGSVEIDGAGVTQGLNTAVFTRISFVLNNNVQAMNGLGQTSPYSQDVGLANITGQVEGFLTGDTGWDMYERALANSDFDLKFTLTQNAKSYTIDIPQAKLNGSAPRNQGINTRLTFSFGYRAVVTSPIITRVT